MRLLAHLIMMVFSTICIAEVHSIDNFDGFNWGVSLYQIEKKHGDKYVQKVKEITYTYFSIKKRSEFDTVGGFEVSRRIFIFDEKCGFFTSCRLVKGEYGLGTSDNVSISSFINKLSRKYGTFLEAESPNYTLGAASRGFENTYEKKELYWFANDQTYIKLSYGILIKAEHSLSESTIKIGDIHHIKLTYSGLSDVVFKEDPEDPTTKELGF